MEEDSNKAIDLLFQIVTWLITSFKHTGSQNTLICFFKKYHTLGKGVLTNLYDLVFALTYTETVEERADNSIKHPMMPLLHGN